MNRIVLFGEPCSGKTTMAKELAKCLRAKIVEASEAIIFPIAASFKTLPKEEYVLNNIQKISKKNYGTIDRKTARGMFSRFKKASYSKDFIAKALHELYVKNPKYKRVIFSGVRGFDNAKYCRLHNDLVVYLKSNMKDLVARLQKDRGYRRQEALDELKGEQQLYKTKNIEKMADIVVNTSLKSVPSSTQQILAKLDSRNRMCERCVNTGRNPAIKFNSKGYCHICASYIKHFDPSHLKKELDFLKTFREKSVMVGISGGKDSTATLYNMMQTGFKPLAFTFNLGYLPETTIPRARGVAKFLSVDYEVIDIRKYVRKIDRDSYKKTIELYERPFILETKNEFKKAYAIGRKHYSVKCQHSPAFVRTCQLCRRMVIRAYYGEALKRGIHAIVLGMNEWTNLSAAQVGKKYVVSGIRKLQPYKNKPAVFVFHLPFLLQMTSKDTKKILDKLGWKPPKGEDFIESNSNSCLFARSTERMAKRLLEFHPDSTRLAREVTVGFITKKQALKALGKLHPYKYTPRQVLERAKIV